MSRKETFSPRFFSFAAGLVVAFLIAILTSTASPGLAIGVADNNAFKTPDKRGEVAAKSLGFNLIRIFLWYHPGQTVLTPVQKQNLALALANLPRSSRLLVSVAGKPYQTGNVWTSPKGITNPAERGDYTRLLVDMVRTFPAIRDVSIWNEPNYPLFWSDRDYAPQRYAALLAASYDALHPYHVRVYGFELHPWRQPVKWITSVGAWMRTTHRKRPLFDYVATHPYPHVNNEVPWTRHWQPGVLGMGDVQRLRGLLRKAFSRTAQLRYPIVYTETGWTTAGFAPYAVTPPVQAKRMVQALELAYCQRGVYAFVSFLLWDSSDYWQTGLIFPDRMTHKPAYAAYKAAVARVHARRVRCSDFPRNVL
jgi:hypothetical protein